MNCVVCNSEFEGRADAKYCSSKCRVAHNRKLSVTDNHVTDNSVTDNPVKSVTDNLKVLTLEDFGLSLSDLGVKFAPAGGPIILRNDATSEQIYSLVRVMKAMKGQDMEGRRTREKAESIEGIQ